MYSKEKLENFLKIISERTPVPGGGSASAFCGAIGASLNSMVIRYSNTSKGITANQKLLKKSEKIWKELLKLTDEDSKAYDNLRIAYKLAKLRPKKKKNIQKALTKAIVVPWKTSLFCYEAIKISKYLVKFGNKNLLSDIGVAILLLNSGLRGACFNVLINVSQLSKKEKATSWKRNVKKLIRISENITINSLKVIESNLMPAC